MAKLSLWATTALIASNMCLNVYAIEQSSGSSAKSDSIVTTISNTLIRQITQQESRLAKEESNLNKMFEMELDEIERLIDEFEPNEVCQCDDSVCPTPAGGGGGSGGGGGGCCFTADTLISLTDGSQKIISEIAKGDVVLGQDGSHNTVDSIIKVPSKGRKIYGINGSIEFISDDHPLLTTNGWKSFNPEKSSINYQELEISQLNIGDTLITASGELEIKSTSYKISDANPHLYTLSTSGGNHTFLANGLVSHNQGGSCGLGPGAGGPGGGTGGSIICSEIVRQGLFPAEMQNIYMKVNNSNPYAIAAYHGWAKHVVRLMQKSKLVTNIAAPIATAWMRENLYQGGKIDKQSRSYLWNYFFLFAYPLHIAIGRIFFYPQAQEIKFNRNNYDKNLTQNLWGSSYLEKHSYDSYDIIKTMELRLV